MLSGETASGRYPLLAVRMMDRVVREAERHLALGAPPVDPWTDVGAVNAVTAAAAVHAALAVLATAIACFTMSGTTARLLSPDGLARPGDRVVLVFGSPLGVAGQTNSFRLHPIPPPA